MVSIPLPLVTRSADPGALERHPSDGLLVVEQLERTLPDQFGLLARLAAGLAADAQRPARGPTAGIGRRIARRLLRGRR